MSILAIYKESGELVKVIEDNYEEIAQRLSSIGVRFESWTTDRELPFSATQEQVLEAYRNG